MKKIKRMTCGLLPLLAGAAVLIEHYTVPNVQAVSGALPVFIGILMCGVLILTLLSIQSSSVLNWLRDRSAWYTAIFLIFLVLDVLTQKTGIFGPPMFPSPDRLLAELVLDRSILLDCAGNSLKLLFTGYFWGMLIGLLTGIPAGLLPKSAILDCTDSSRACANSIRYMDGTVFCALQKSVSRLRCNGRVFCMVSCCVRNHAWDFAGRSCIY